MNTHNNNSYYNVMGAYKIFLKKSYILSVNPDRKK